MLNVIGSQAWTRDTAIILTIDDILIFIKIWPPLIQNIDYISYILINNLTP